MKFHMEGVFPAMITPFTRNGARVDLDKTAAVAEHLAGTGIHGLFVCGTTGEGLLMTPAERKQVLETVIAAVGRRVMIIAHVGALDTATAVDLARHAAAAGAVACAAVAPAFFTYDAPALVKHFTTLAAAVPGFPVLLYNIPRCAGNRITPELVVELAHARDNIVGVKDSGGSIQDLNRILASVPAGFNVINGIDEYTFQAYMGGVNGSVASTGNVVPELFVTIFNSVRKGDLARARKAQEKLAVACEVYRRGTTLAYYKEGLRLRGVDAGYMRPPQRELTARERKELAERLKAAGLLVIRGQATN